MKSRFGRDTVLRVRFPQLEQADVEIDRGVKRFELTKNWESSTIDWSTSFLSQGKRSPHYSNFFKISEDNLRTTKLFSRQLVPKTESVTPQNTRFVKTQMSNYPEVVNRSASTGKSEARRRNFLQTQLVVKNIMH
mmetsp:Transcript_32536/g.56258  ORF Transcript_32536/g.56258 Transcript_32536/m.56258 type:complete len:135 (-) Transcript_32536:8-412(-)